SGLLATPEDRTVSGRFAVEVEAFWFPNQVEGKNMMPGEAGWGITLSDASADPGTQHRGEFLIRRDGMAAIRVFFRGDTTMMAEWKADSVITPHDGENIIKYVLRVEHEHDGLSFKVNGSEVINMPVEHAPETITPGLRVGPALNLHVSRFDLVTPLVPAKQSAE
ncbi:MAG: hypothetical protein ACREL6_06985, partial [Gemmatimonadales bacterium]